MRTTSGRSRGPVIRALPGTQVPVGVVTGLLGGPYFLLLLRRTDSFNEF